MNAATDAPLSPPRRPSPARHVLRVFAGVVIAFVLYCAQLLLQGQAGRFVEAEWAQKPDLLPLAQVVALLDLKSLVLVALPVMLLGFLAGWAAAKAFGASKALGRTLAVSWLLVSLVCWVTLFLTLSGNDPTKWSPAILSQPAFWYPLIGTAVALYLGSAMRSAADRPAA
ncbi:hypothetical protein [Piscinibacter koreensis]|uniref:Uncharacterized protein n=1 Tax=Piscinibacter koreensis TaxID=2742824 RepID=A0A7Y6NNP1_9BURK|nr:hypothetical protein [Schlegelella koreensis]NUZ06548.1 hypothetical protein [Schlegelella koreensis]